MNRRLTQLGFFALFLLAPALNLFRYDLQAGHAWILGMPWQLGLDSYLAQTRSGPAPLSLTLGLLLRLFLPIGVGAALFLTAAAKWGRLYCGWLCPHFSMVETLNALMARATGRSSLWQRSPLPPWQADGRPRVRQARWWLVLMPTTLAMAFLWSITLLTYLEPPALVWGGLLRADLPRGPALFLGVGTLVFSLEFLFARHLFCRYACAVGMFQSLAWMANPRALVVGFDRTRGRACGDCLPDGSAACEANCPMHLRPRNLKRLMFACAQCARCLDACATSQQSQPQGPLLHWIRHEQAAQQEARFRAASGPARPGTV